MTERTKVLQQLRQMADELEVKLHLAGMDAKDAWAKLEPRLRAYEAKAENAVDKVAEELVAAGKDLERDLSRLLERVKSKAS